MLQLRNRSKVTGYFKSHLNRLFPEVIIIFIFTSGCLRERFLLGFDLICDDGCWLSSQDSIHFKSTIISFKMSGQQTLQVSRNWIDGQYKLNIPNWKIQQFQVYIFLNKLVKLNCFLSNTFINIFFVFLT